MSHATHVILFMKNEFLLSDPCGPAPCGASSHESFRGELNSVRTQDRLAVQTRSGETAAVRVALMSRMLLESREPVERGLRIGIYIQLLGGGLEDDFLMFVHQNPPKNEVIKGFPD